MNNRHKKAVSNNKYNKGGRGALGICGNVQCILWMIVSAPFFFFFQYTKTKSGNLKNFGSTNTGCQNDAVKYFHIDISENFS